MLPQNNCIAQRIFVEVNPNFTQAQKHEKNG